MTFLERAQVLTSRGIPLIPVEPHSKRAFLKGWDELATTDMAQVSAWAAEFPNHNTGAVGKVDGHLILDIDDKEIAYQLAAVDLDLQHIETFKVQGKKVAPCGHYYFQQTAYSRSRLKNWDLRLMSRATGQKVSTLFDLKFNNGYVVGPGSVHPEGPTYTIEGD